ncbi:hypothetical protein SeMB42_g02031 [Synchytrium endobioticum]|uniref:Cyclin N-terminal domain-containing protein n=1 Tax=Synchytrium endobioticum TaxID=286115 RepID=A0A507DH80_9FUNG|nr:hypothetical protein SeMB42_g02031 [Synchytrium endobioticum]
MLSSIVPASFDADISHDISHHPENSIEANNWGNTSKGSNTSDVVERPAKKQTLNSSKRVPLQQLQIATGAGNAVKVGQGSDVSAALKAIKARQVAASRVRTTRQKQKASQNEQPQQPSAWAAAPPRETSLGQSPLPNSAVKSSIPRSSAEARALRAAKRQSTSSNVSSVTSNRSGPVIVHNNKHSVVSLPKTIPSLGMNIDFEDSNWMNGGVGRRGEVESDPLLAVEYVLDICSYLRDLEARTLGDPRYMERQPGITWAMRSTLVDWLIQVHHHLRLLPETLYLAINLTDRFLSYRCVTLCKFQLVGVAALLIACKYEEIVVPCISDFIYMVEGGYTREEIIQAERYILAVLKYDLSNPGPMTFLRRISKADSYDVHTRTLSKYLIESTLTDERFVGIPYSLITAGAMYLSRKVLSNDDWSPMHHHISGYDEATLVPIAHGLLDCASQYSKHSFVHSKYSEARYMNASGFMQEYCQRIHYVPMAMEL